MIPWFKLPPSGISPPVLLDSPVAENSQQSILEGKMTEPSNSVRFPQCGTHERIERDQQACLTKLDRAPVDAYTRILRQFTQWIVTRPGYRERFQSASLSTPVVEDGHSLLTQRARGDSLRS